MAQAINPTQWGLSEKDFIKADTALIGGTYQEVARFTIPIGQAYNLGIGRHNALHDATGRILNDLKSDLNATIDGAFRFVMVDPNDETNKTLFGGRITEYSAGLDDRAKRRVFPERGERLGENWSFKLEVKADADVTLSKANSVMRIDCMKWTVR